MGFRLANVGGRAALVVGDDYYDVESVSGGSIGGDPMHALRHAADLMTVASTLDEQEPTGLLDDVTLGPPVPAPQKCFGIGLNYLDHATEASVDVPKNPLVFTKFPSCLVGPTADVELRSGLCDYEGELVVVIGEGGRDIAPEMAWAHVAGVAVGQDISDREMQFAASPPHFDLGKSYDTFGPIGPVMVSADEIADVGALRITTTVNGEARQNDTVANMVFDVPTLIAYLSQVTTLVTGDLIFTGTPAGVGAPQGKFLADGDIIVTTIDGIGSITNRCVMVEPKGRPA
jgi:2-keto-4-pentenoate hydratase/2-oxohepta-3-ene-1,7-dioic acid hydratase in catechol pathway